jgi:hypothetical protein
LHDQIESNINDEDKDDKELIIQQRFNILDILENISKIGRETK